MIIKKRCFIRIISFFTAALLAAVGFAVVECNNKKKYIMQVQYTYSRNFEEMAACLNNISTTLEKVLYCTTPTEMTVLASELWKESGTAKSALSQLPQGEQELTTVNRFLSQVGDYSLFLSKKLIIGSEITEDEKENLRKLSVTAVGIANSINDASVLFSEGYWNLEAMSELDSEYVSSFGESLAQIEDTLTDYPTLIYDGPFSDHILLADPKMTENAPEISEAQAREIALDIFDGEVFEKRSDEKGKMTCYCFGTENAEVYITVQGGYIADYRKYRSMGNATLSYSEAVEKAKEYLSEAEGEFVPTYYFADEGMCTVNFAYVQDGVVCYSDLIKIGVALDDGELLMVESRGYIMNHYTREIQPPQNSEAVAREKISDSLTVTSVQTVLVPTSLNNERLCYEYLCTAPDGKEILVFIDTETLVETDILILLKTDGGTLVK